MTTCSPAPPALPLHLSRFHFLISPSSQALWRWWDASPDRNHHNYTLTIMAFSSKLAVIFNLKPKTPAQHQEEQLLMWKPEIATMWFISAMQCICSTESIACTIHPLLSDVASCMLSRFYNTRKQVINSIRGPISYLEMVGGMKLVLIVPVFYWSLWFGVVAQHLPYLSPLSSLWVFLSITSSCLLSYFTSALYRHFIVEWFIEQKKFWWFLTENFNKCHNYTLFNPSCTFMLFPLELFFIS